jgi:hypothetical protein
MAFTFDVQFLVVFVCPVVHLKKWSFLTVRTLFFSWFLIHRVLSWGWGVHGQLGHGSPEDELVPKCIQSLTARTVVRAAAGYCHSLVLTELVSDVVDDDEEEEEDGNDDDDDEDGDGDDNDDEDGGADGDDDEDDDDGDDDDDDDNDDDIMTTTTTNDDDDDCKDNGQVMVTTTVEMMIFFMFVCMCVCVCFLCLYACVCVCFLCCYIIAMYLFFMFVCMCVCVCFLCCYIIAMYLFLLLLQGEVWSFGCGYFGQLGIGQAHKRTSPVLVSFNEPVTVISTKFFHNVSHFQGWGSRQIVLSRQVSSLQREELTELCRHLGDLAKLSSPDRCSLYRGKS